MDAIYPISNTIIRDNIEGNRLIEATKEVRSVIDTREFQRLRYIKQMGLSSFVFPTAEHSRFAHSLGVYANAKLVFNHLKKRAEPLDLQLEGLIFDQTTELEFCLAALCHDIGHSAFSHVLENVLLPEGMKNHEDCTLAILREETEISKQIDSVADRDAVLNMLMKVHPNKALCDLISSTFDVDRCDYVLRDSMMAGVEYGKYDLKWLVHAITVETNQLGQPVVLLDGPRGLDALRQFLDARHHLHRQVYLHPTIRGAQILLKSIFARMQDLGATDDAKSLVPYCLRSITEGKRLSLDNFIRTTDIEVLFMIRRMADEHSDPTMRMLCELFVQRKFPKCVLDSAKFCVPLANKYSVEMAVGEKLEIAEKSLTDVTEELQSFIAAQFERNSLPREAAKYLVSFDPVKFNSTPPSDILFLFRNRSGPEIVPYDLIDHHSVGFNLDGLMESFTISRIFVPREFVSEAREYLDRNYGK